MDVKTNQKLMILELADSLARSWWTVVAGVCLGLAAVLVVLQYTPRIYEATARLDLSAEKLPQRFVTDAVATNPQAQLRHLRQTVLSERHLDKLIADEFPPPQTEDERKALIGRVRSGVSVRYPGWDDYFMISFRDPDPRRAARIANALAGFYVAENVNYRVDKADETVETLKSLASQRWEEVQAKAKEIEKFRARYPGRSEADRPANQRSLDEARQELRSNQDEQADLRESLEILEAQGEQEGLMDLFSPVTSPGSAGAGTSLTVLESELSDLLVKYSENHPLVRAKRIEIEEQRKRSLATGGGTDTATTSPEFESEVWDVFIQTSRAEMEKLQEKEREIRASIKDYSARLAETPMVQQHLEQLTQDRTILEADYKQKRADAVAAETSQRVERQGQGKQMEIIGGASAPSKPVYPRATLFYGSGLGLGLLLFVGPVLARRLLIPVVSSRFRLTEAADVPVLVTIPAIPTSSGSRHFRLMRLKNFTLSLLSVAALLAVLGLRWSDLL